MATYKVIQDIEAEDKFLGPLTLKQFIFGAIGAVSGYICFFLFTKGLWYIAAFILPVVVVMVFLAFPWGRDQPTEIWLAAKLRFMFKPRKRIWDQSGMEELVTITAPKIEDPYVSNNLSQTEVKSRLSALSTTLDSRGWAVKNNNLNLFTQPAYATGAVAQQSDRLIGFDVMNVPGSTTDVRATDDIMDAQFSPIAQQFDSMLNTATQEHRAAAMQQIEKVRSSQSVTSQPTPMPNYWFMDAPATPAPNLATFSTQTMPVPNNSPKPDMFKAEVPGTDEKALLDKVRTERSQLKASNSHMKTINPLGALPPQPNQQKTASVMTGTPVPDKIRLARNNDRSVASIEREANQKQPDEIVISLH